MTQVMLTQLSLAMEEGKVGRWLVADGELVSAGQPIVEIETDKAVAQVEAPAAGRIRRAVPEGALIPVESLLAEITELDHAASSAAITADSVTATSTAAIGQEVPPQTSFGPESYTVAGGKHRASPAARRLATERGLDLEPLRGSGPGGRITVRDLGATRPDRGAALRDAVVAQLAASWREIPHIHVGGEIDGTGLAAAKVAAPAGTSVTDLLILATIRALREVPELNGTIGKISARMNVALAVATRNGVIAPVIRQANDLSLLEITRERARLVAAARAGTPDSRDLAGGTITVTNLGAYPVDFFAPIISGPQIAMLAIGRLTERPFAMDGIVSVRHRIWVNVAIDHRAADGMSGARFLAALEHCMSGFRYDLA